MPWIRRDGVDFIETKGGSNPALEVSGKVSIKTTRKYSESDLPKNPMKLKSLAKSEGMKADNKTKKEEMVSYLLSLEG